MVLTYTVLDIVIIFVAIIAAFVIGSKLLKSTEISMALAGVVAVIFSTAHGWTTEPVKVIVEGLFTNMDLAMTFIFATLFVNIYSMSGSMTAITRSLVSHVNNKWLLMACMAVLMLIPGAITGAGSVSVFVLGAMVYSIIRFMGVSEKKATAFVFVFAIMSAACPPINLWTMLMTAQANMPYVGFELLLLIPIVIAGAFAIIYFGWGAKRASKEEILATLPEVNKKMGGFGGLIRILLPMLALVLMFVLTLVIPFQMPVLGLPLMFVICAASCASLSIDRSAPNDDRCSPGTPDCRTPRKSPGPRSRRSSCASAKPSFVLQSASSRSLVPPPVCSENRMQYEGSSPRPTRPRSWCSCASPNRSAFSMTMTVAFGTFTPTSMTVVDTSSVISPAANARMIRSFSAGFIRPCRQATR